MNQNRNTQPADKNGEVASETTLEKGKFVNYPDSPFQSFQPFEPAGDQPQAIAGLIEGIEDGLSFQTLLGVTGSGKTFTMANVIAKTGRPALCWHQIKR